MQCPACGEEIRIVTVPGGRRVTIDGRSDYGRGPDRYFVEPEDASRARPVSPRFAGNAHGDHSVTCEGRR
jgi:hypothetical protein